MKRAAAVLATVSLAVIFLAGPVLARSGQGKIAAVNGDRVVVQLEKGKGAGFPVGMRDVEIKGGGASVRGRIVESSADRITIKVVRGKVSALSVGAAVEVGQAADAGAEGIDGCRKDPTFNDLNAAPGIDIVRRGGTARASS